MKANGYLGGILSLILVGILYCILSMFGGPIFHRDPRPVHILPMDTTILDVMDLCKASVSPGRKLVLVSQIDRIAREVFHDNQQQREAFVLLLCIESKFNSAAKSSSGAIGLSQVMGRYVKDFARLCNLPELTAQDLQDSEVNLRVGACYFKHLLDRFKGNVTLALAGYNSGPDSITLMNLKALRTGHPETMAYVARFAYLREELDRNVR